MSKYAPLKEFLMEQGRDYVPMSFAEIEKVLDFPLPHSKRYPAWWSNNASNNTMTQEWLDAGYETESVNIGGEKLVFRRVRKKPSLPSAPVASSAGDGGGEGGGGNPAPARRHPLFGCLKGTVTIPPGVDLTEPSDPDLADYLDRKYGLEVRPTK